MKRLCELVDVAVNNENCVVFKIKDNTLMDLIALGCFTGYEDMLRMTKGKTPEITVFYKDGSNFSYHFGEGSTTIVTDNRAQQRSMIRECAILDFGIVSDWAHMGPDKQYLDAVRNTMYIKSMDDAVRNVTLVSGGGMGGHIRVNEQHVASDVHVRNIAKWFNERGYAVEFDRPIERTGLPCGKVYGACYPIEALDKKLTADDISRERLKDLLSNTLSEYCEGYMEDLYEALSSQIGMTDEEIEAFGYGYCIEKDESLDKLLADAEKRAGKSGPGSDGSGPNGGAGCVPERDRERD